MNSPEGSTLKSVPKGAAKWETSPDPRSEPKDEVRKANERGWTVRVAKLGTEFGNSCLGIRS